MAKIAYVSVTFLYSFEPKDLNLDDNCTEDEFRAAVENRMREEEMIMPHSFEDDKVKDYIYCPYCAHKFNKERIYHA